MRHPALFSALALAAALALPARADLRPAAIFTDNMVLQQQKPVPVWGWADPGAEVTVSFAGQTARARAGADGKWRVTLRKLKASSQPGSLVIGSAGGSRTCTNVLVGEVWLASGQSNMEKPIGNQPGQRPTFDAWNELAAAAYPGIRIFKIERALSATPEPDLGRTRGWAECGSNSLDTISFSAVAYFFGQMVHTNLGVPVGLIESSWGGTRIEPWTPPAGFEEVPALAALARQPDPGTNRISASRPTALYNAMIHPIAGFALRGALWYQGESNLGDTDPATGFRQYDQKMRALVGGWRKAWGAGDFPFYFVQIAPFAYHAGNPPRVASTEILPEFWTVQSRAARAIRNSGMVVTTDLVDDLNDIHPRNKKDVGRRLALLALDKTYGKRMASEGPAFERMKISGGKVIVEFERAHGGLKSRDGQPLTWFSVAGADGYFVDAAARITGPETVEVSAEAVPAPRAVRFAWDETARPNLCNGAGLPAEPFRAP